VFLVLLEQTGIKDFLFCDSNESFHGCTVKGHDIISPQVLYNSPDDYIVVVTPQDDEEIVNSLQDHGFINKKNFYAFGNAVYRLFIEEFKNKTLEGELLLLGDCNFLSSSLHEENKMTLTELLRAEITLPIRALNLPAINFRAIYHILKLQIKAKHIPKYIIFSLDITQLNGVQHLMPGSQHVKLFMELRKYTNDGEFLAYADLLEQRHKKFNKFSFSRKTSGENSFASNNLYIKTKYMYQKDFKKSEEFFYLKELLCLAESNNIIAIPVMMPVNFERCRYYCGILFDKLFVNNCTMIKQELKKTKNILDLSYLLGTGYFNDNTTFDEAPSYDGRKKTCESIAKYLVKLQ
jgi:hypothetical protein